MKAFLTVPTNAPANWSWDQLPQLEIEAENRETLVLIAKIYSAQNDNKTVRMSDSKGYRNQGAYINNYDIKISKPL